jgi:hypothetical protein
MSDFADSIVDEYLDPDAGGLSNVRPTTGALAASILSAEALNELEAHSRKLVDLSRSLVWLTRILIAATAVLVILTVVLVWRTF